MNKWISLSLLIIFTGVSLIPALLYILKGITSWILLSAVVFIVLFLYLILDREL